MAQDEKGSVLKSSDQVQVGERIRVKLAQGSLQCSVEGKGE